MSEMIADMTTAEAVFRLKRIARILSMPWHEAEEPPTEEAGVDDPERDALAISHVLSLLESEEK